jgi:hypothetical protein
VRTASRRPKAEQPSTGTTPAPTGPVCEIHWLPRARGSCFSAVTSDADGGTKSVATSRRVETRGSAPPEQSPEAMAALRQLMKTLRDGGWVLMRSRRADADEPWYTRRFRHVATDPQADDGGAAGNGEPTT